MASSSAKMDAADEAGGETIFSSDGMEPLPIPAVPLVSQQQEENIYQVLETDTPLVDLSTLQESPQERLARLTREVESLQMELKGNEQVSKLARELSSKLSLTSAHDELVRSIQQRVSNKNKNDGEESGVVYELYGGATTSSSSSIEERLAKMERLVGGSGAITASSLSERMDRVENMASRIDEKALDNAATRAKVIRADLEAASKARNKLGNAAVSSNDAKQISELHQQLQQLEGIGMHLPALSLRLQQLAALHSQGATFSNRLSGIERELPTIQSSLQQLQESLSKVEEGMLTNITTVEENIKVLESKMK